MPFSYYEHLNRQQRADYDRSDSVGTIRLPYAMDCHPGLHGLMDALAMADRAAAEGAAREIADSILDQLKVRQVRIKVRARRPVDETGELHGLYEPPEGRRWGLITLWMRTAKRNQVVAFKSFLRTLLHELCHHLDYELFELDETFHTEGFYRRESSLYHQIVRGSRAAPPRRATERRYR